jgi:ribosome-associated toxin RatA of RatAB toxin-antitoxin module
LKRGSQQALIHAAPQVCFDAITDYETFPDWQAAVKSVEIESRWPDGRGREVAFRIDAKVKTVAYRLSYSYDEPHRIWWDYLGGDVKNVEGEYRFEERVDGTTLATYSVGLDAGVWMPGPVRTLLTDQVMKRSVQELKQRAEGRAA